MRGLMLGLSVIILSVTTQARADAVTNRNSFKEMFAWKTDVLDRYDVASEADAKKAMMRIMDKTASDCGAKFEKNRIKEFDLAKLESKQCEDSLKSTNESRKTFAEGRGLGKPKDFKKPLDKIKK